MLRKLFGDEGAAISIMAALSLAAVIGVSALAVEFGHGLLLRTEDQRVADLAAYGGALVYNSTGSSTEAAGAVSNIAALNGISSGVTSSVVNSPTGDGSQAMRVTVTTTMPLYLARVLTNSASLAVGATAYAEMKANTPGCVVALNSGASGISLSGGTQMTADNCSVASNNAVTLTGGTTITTKTVDYGTTYSVSGGSSIVTPSGGTPTYSKVTTTDPLKSNSSVTTATSRLSTVASIASPGAPTVTPLPSGGTAIAFAYSAVSASNLPTGCSDSYASSTHTVTCGGSGPFNISSMTVGGGLTVNFNKSGSSSAAYNFSSSISNSGGDTVAFGPGTFTVNGSITSSGTLSFGAGTFKVNGTIANSSGAMTFGAGTFAVTGGITTGGGTTTTFGAGTFNIGTTACSGAPSPTTGYSICNSGTTLTFAGPSTFVLSGGVYNSGGETLTLGSAGTTANSYDIGAAADGYSLYAGGGATTTLYDATGSGDLFETAGSIASSGGTCLTIPAAAEHDINGFISLGGGTTLGAGVYTVSDYVAFGAIGGGDVTCGGSKIGVSGSGVTLVIGGTTVPSSGSCSGASFCVASGFSNVTLTAPGSGTTEDLLVIGPPSTSSNSTAGATFTDGSSNTSLSGAFYFPNGPISLGGSATIGNGSGQCLELIGSQVGLSGGSAIATTCTGIGGGTSTGSAVALVQ